MLKRFVFVALLLLACGSASAQTTLPCTYRGGYPWTVGGCLTADDLNAAMADAKAKPNTLPWGSITSTPTTLLGYGITGIPWSLLSGTPTTLAGYGVNSVPWNLVTTEPAKNNGDLASLNSALYPNGIWRNGVLVPGDASPVRYIPSPSSCPLTTATFIGSIAGSVLTVSSITSGSLRPGLVLAGIAIPSGLMIASNGTGTGGTGTYNLSATATISSQGMTAPGDVGSQIPDVVGNCWLAVFPAQIDARQFGVVNDGICTGVYAATLVGVNYQLPPCGATGFTTTSGSATFSGPTIPTSMVGKSVIVAGAGSNGLPLTTTFASTTTFAIPAGVTQSGSSYFISQAILDTGNAGTCSQIGDILNLPAPTNGAATITAQVTVVQISPTIVVQVTRPGQYTNANPFNGSFPSWAPIVTGTSAHCLTGLTIDAFPQKAGGGAYGTDNAAGLQALFNYVAQHPTNVSVPGGTYLVNLAPSASYGGQTYLGRLGDTSYPGTPAAIVKPSGIKLDMQGATFLMAGWFSYVQTTSYFLSGLNASNIQLFGGTLTQAPFPVSNFGANTLSPYGYTFFEPNYGGHSWFAQGQTIHGAEANWISDGDPAGVLGNSYGHTIIDQVCDASFYGIAMPGGGSFSKIGVQSSNCGRTFFPRGISGVTGVVESQQPILNDALIEPLSTSCPGGAPPSPCLSTVDGFDIKYIVRPHNVNAFTPRASSYLNLYAGGITGYGFYNNKLDVSYSGGGDTTTSCSAPIVEWWKGTTGALSGVWINNIVSGSLFGMPSSCVGNQIEIFPDSDASWTSETAVGNRISGFSINGGGGGTVHIGLNSSSATNPFLLKDSWFGNAVTTTGTSSFLKTHTTTANNVYTD